MSDRRKSLGFVASLAVMAGISVAVSNSFEPRKASAAGSVSSSPNEATSLQNLYVNISEKMMPSVVNIFTTKKVRPMPRMMPRGIPNDFWNEFFENQDPSPQAFHSPAAGLRPAHVVGYRLYRGKRSREWGPS